MLGVIGGCAICILCQKKKKDKKQSDKDSIIPKPPTAPPISISGSSNYACEDVGWTSSGQSQYPLELIHYQTEPNSTGSSNS